MIYQLAKTSPLLTGQVKMNMILNGNKVVDIQYVPISNHIPFNYNNPIDVLNYSHGDNVKALYNRISEQFFSEVTDPTLSVNQLHRYVMYRDDTHENTYEMGMKRLTYQRYKKQFEFFCPFWCDDLKDMDTIYFMINLANKNGRIMYSKKIVFDEKIEKYIKNIYPSLNFESGITENNDLLYINFNEVQSHIKGLHVESGALKTIDTSYIVNNLLYQERPVLETDNMLVGLFSQNKTVCTQLFNFNFVFDMEDFLPLDMLKNLIGDKVNVYIDIYWGEDNVKKAELKDLYSNYEFIPKYDISTGEYSDVANVLDYLGDNNSIELINKNKLTQGTFHWVLENNRKSIFNLYNGFSPLNNGEKSCTAISNDAPDMFVDEFNEDKNPAGIFKFIDASDPSITTNDFLEKIYNKNNYFELDIKNDVTNQKDKEYIFFGNVLLSVEKLKSILSKNKNTPVYACFGSKFNESSKSRNKHEVEVNKILGLRCIVVKIPDNFNSSKIKGILGDDYKIYCLHSNNTVGEGLNATYTLSDCNYLVLNQEFQNNNIYDKNGNLRAGVVLNVIFFVKYYDDITKEILSFNNFYDRDCDFKYESRTLKSINKKNDTIFSEYGSKRILDFIGIILQCAKFPNDILFDKSINNKKANSPSEKSTEQELLKIDKFVELYRYDSKLLPMFIDLHDPVFKNYLYWCKQYDTTVQKEILNEKKVNSNNGINSIDDIEGINSIDDIETYSKFALKKFSPVYKSLGYYVLNPTNGINYPEKYKNKDRIPIDYTNYYLNGTDYKKEISWYKNNSMIYLPNSFTSTITKPSDKGITDNDIIDEMYKYLRNDSEFEEYKDYDTQKEEKQKEFIRYYIKDLYQYTYTYDYVSIDDISKQKYEIKFTLK